MTRLHVYEVGDNVHFASKEFRNELVRNATIMAVRCPLIGQPRYLCSYSGTRRTGGKWFDTTFNEWVKQVDVVPVSTRRITP